MLVLARMRTWLAISAVVLTAAPAYADELNKCATADTSHMFDGNDAVDLSGDTGWFPSGYVAQLRLTAQVAGHTNVNVGYRANACWDKEMNATLAGVPGSGYIDVAYGAELALYGRIKTTVLGYNIDWEGPIDIPYIPEDLLLARAGYFNPRLDTFGVYVQDTTDPINVLSTDTLASVISLGGISGGLYISVQGGMTTTYRAKNVTLDGSQVDAETDQVGVDQPSGGFHSTASLPVTVEGTVHYQPQLVFAAGFNVKIFGVQVVNWQFGSIAMSLPAIDRSIKLTDDHAIEKLPELDGIGDGARMDFQSATTQFLHVRNTGEAPLQLFPQPGADGVQVAPITIAPKDEGDLSVIVSEGALANGSTTLQIATNDPDRPLVSVELGMDVGGTDPGMPPEINPDNGGCSTGGGQGVGALAFVLLAVTRRRRGAVRG